MAINEQPLPFWFDDGSPSRGAAQTEIATLEQHCGHRLPASFRALLLERNGGVSNFDAFHVGEVYARVSTFFDVETITRSFDTADQFGTPDGVLAIASGAHDWIGLDFRQAGEPTVVENGAS